MDPLVANGPNEQLVSVSKLNVSRMYCQDPSKSVGSCNTVDGNCVSTLSRTQSPSPSQRFQLCLCKVSMESLHFLHFQADHSYAHIALFRNVSNSEKLKNRLVSASLIEGELGDKEREAVNFAFIDARLVSQPS